MGSYWTFDWYALPSLAYLINFKLFRLQQLSEASLSALPSETVSSPSTSLRTFLTVPFVYLCMSLPLDVELLITGNEA